MPTPAAVLLILLAGLFAQSPSDWTRFRGPNGSGVSPATGVPTEFGPARNVVWKTPVPPGHSSPVVSRSHIFLTAHEADTLLVLAFDRANGRELWRRELPRARKDRLDGPNGPASPSAVTDGKRVFAFFQDFGLIALTVDGRELWRLPLGPFNMAYGFGASPIVVDDVVLLAVDQDTGSVPPRGACRKWTDQVQGRPARRDLGVFDADRLPAEGRRHTDHRSGVVPAVGLCRRGWPPRLVGARPRVRNEVGRQHRRRDACM